MLPVFVFPVNKDYQITISPKKFFTNLLPQIHVHISAANDCVSAI